MFFTIECVLYNRMCSLTSCQHAPLPACGAPPSFFSPRPLSCRVQGLGFSYLGLGARRSLSAVYSTHTLLLYVYPTPTLLLYVCSTSTLLLYVYSTPTFLLHVCMHTGFRGLEFSRRAGLGYRAEKVACRVCRVCRVLV